MMSTNPCRKLAKYIDREGTVKVCSNCIPKVDAKALKNFIEVADEKSILSILANRSSMQRVLTALSFKLIYRKDLVEELNRKLNGNLETVLLCWMMHHDRYFAKELHKAISNIGTREDVLVEILCTRHIYQEIWDINEAYNHLYGKSLEDDIRSVTSGHLKELLVSVCNGAKFKLPVSGINARQTAKILIQSGAAQWGTDESMLKTIFLSESFCQLAYIFYEYQQLTGCTIVQAIENEMSGDLKQGMLVLAKCVENRPFYFAEKLYKSMKGSETDDNALIRIVVSRCEIDMVQIKEEYSKSYGKTLAKAITEDTSDDYKRVLVALVGN